MIKCPHCGRYLPQKERGKSNATPSLVFSNVRKRPETIQTVADRMNMSYYSIAPVLAFLASKGRIICERKRNAGRGWSKLHYRIP